jgi:adenylate cyclase
MCKRWLKRTIAVIISPLGLGFTSAMQAIEAARRCVATSADSELRLHVGLDAGDVIREENNVYGGAVNIASRICSLCEPGEILVSATIRELARTSAGVTFDDRGEQLLRGIDDPVRVFAVRPESG